ncbi:hypothetical protein SCUCBS95973_008356 [Sporothrix curviconia]|uniref:AMP-activated protein kinase glycogen-binding domain-containing protein n=1 Tax=Sporothrix curviconia TaxID=1260050 RepID=A0ABP0CLN0_9PEZI
MAKDDTAVEITYRSSDLQPPLWVAGSFSNPPWTPFEMQHRTAANGEHIFTRAIHVKPGTAVQYKFRVGSGDWWVLDESVPTVTDDMGNRNNLLRVNEFKGADVHSPPTPPPDSPVLQAGDLAVPGLQVPGDLSRSNASTPSFVRTTMEVADTAAQLDARSGMPTYVRTTMEVADTAARIDAGTSTPSFVQTTMEVADTAARIDAGTPESSASEPDKAPDSSIDDLDVDIGPEFPHERPGEEDDGQDGAPVFAYEFAGTYDMPVNTATSEASPVSQAVADDELDFDPADPTLERFPSNREEILSRVRTLETGLDEDVATYEGYPASPIASRRLDAHKHNTSRDSLVLDQSPSPSLQCIMEEAAPDDRQETALPVATVAEPVLPQTTTANPAPVELEGPAIIVHRATENENTSTEARADSATDAADTADVHPSAFPQSDADPQPSDDGDTGNWIGGFLGTLFRWRR